MKLNNDSLTTTEPKGFRQLLQQELVRRCKANPRYSVRAFARALGTDSSSLSQLLRGKRPLTQAQVMKIGTRLGLTPMELAPFVEAAAPRANPRVADGRDLSVDLFNVIADWYHLAILELVNTKGFKPEGRWIASRLGISVAEATVAIDRLLSLELVKVDENGKWSPSTEMMTTVGNPFTAVAFRKFQAQILQLSATALEELPIEERDHSGITLAMRRDQLGEAKAMIKEFRRKFCETIQGGQPGGDFDSVYQLGVSFFPLTRKSTNHDESVN